MVMSDVQWHAVDVLMSILHLHVRRQRLPWYLASYLWVSMRRGRGRRLLSLAPDLFMVEADDHPRTSWNVEEEGKPPQFVLEVSSLASWERDTEDKPEAYAAMGVSEYAIFLPERSDGGPALFGFRRTPSGEFAPWSTDAQGVLRSDELRGLGLYVEKGRWLRVRTEDGRRLPSAEEEAEERYLAEQLAAEAEQRATAEAAARAEAERRATAEAAARRAAEAEIARLEEELRRLREERD